jgi:hypothetical protein
MSVTTNQVQRVMRASVWARRVATGVMAVMVVGLVWAAFVVLSASSTGRGKVTIAQFVFTSSALESWAVKFWVLLVLSIIAALGLTFLYLLRSIFSNLARGEIFCATNVRHIRSLGLLVIAGGALQWLATIATATYFMFAGYDKISSRQATGDTMFGFDGIAPFAYGALMILLSWIMAVGLGVREDAEKLRHDAELVI